MKWTDNKIGVSEATRISEALMTNNTLTTLDLQGDDKDRKWKKKRKEARYKWNRNERVEEENNMEWNEQGTT